MVAADACDLLIEALVIWRGTACNEDVRAVLSKLAPDAPANAFGCSGHDCDSTV
jgi:hypothetical protein